MKSSFMSKKHTTLTCMLIILSILSCKKENNTTPTRSSDNTISVDVAINAAQQFISKQAISQKLKNGTSETGLTDCNYVLDSVIYSDSSKQVPLIYILKEIQGHGFVITSATNNAPPILAYSTTNAIQKENNLPISLWISSQKQQIEQTRSSGKLKSGTTEGISWADLLPKQETTSTDIQISCETLGPLLETQWGQGDGYNDSLDRYEECTLLKNKRVPTGCVITALTQIMYYWKSPSCFNWQIMPHSNRDSVSAFAWQETAHLMKLMGAICNAEYSCEGTGVTIESCYYKLKECGYACTLNQPQVKENMTEQIIENINALKPVLLCGEDYTHKIGHAWVCDGYSKNNIKTINTQTRTLETESNTNTTFLHMNWGWDGYYDGWFLYDNLNVEEYTFNISAIIYNISPIKDKTLKYPQKYFF